MADKPQSSYNDIMESLAGAHEGYQVFHNQILIAVWIRPSVTSGGVYLPDSAQQEDRYQGKVGLVLKKGPMAFVNDARNDFKGQDVAIGDWVTFRVSDGTSLKLNQVFCRQLEDIHIRGRVEAPDIIW